VNLKAVKFYPPYPPPMIGNSFTSVDLIRRRSSFTILSPVLMKKTSAEEILASSKILQMVTGLE